MISAAVKCTWLGDASSDGIRTPNGAAASNSLCSDLKSEMLPLEAALASVGFSPLRLPLYDFTTPGHVLLVNLSASRLLLSDSLFCCFVKSSRRSSAKKASFSVSQTELWCKSVTSDDTVLVLPAVPWCHTNTFMYNSLISLVSSGHLSHFLFLKLRLTWTNFLSSYAQNLEQTTLHLNII